MTLTKHGGKRDFAIILNSNLERRPTLILSTFTFQHVLFEKSQLLTFKIPLTKQIKR